MFRDILFVSVVAVMVIAFIFNAGEHYSRWKCQSYGSVTGKEVKYIDWDSCYISVNGEWFTARQYRALIVAREGLQFNAN